MPWQEIRPMDQKKEFVREYRRGLYTMTEPAERYAISRKAGYALVRRVEELGVAGLQPQSRRPHTSPNRTPDHVFASQRVVDATRHPASTHPSCVATGERGARADASYAQARGDSPAAGHHAIAAAGL